jgi:hypothetical protein
MEDMIGVLMGVGLAAACGFRVFVPFLVMSLAAQTGHLELISQFDWLASPVATVALATASLVEIAAYYTPWVDNLLDTVAGPAAIVAGTVATASVITDMSPFMRWTLAIIAGGGAAGILQSATTALRLGSTATTAGLANPVVTTGEILGASIVPVIALSLPLVAIGLVALFVWFVWRKTGRLVSAVTGRGAARRAREASPTA